MEPILAVLRKLGKGDGVKYLRDPNTWKQIESDTVRLLLEQIDTTRTQLTTLRDGFISKRVLSDDTKARLTSVIDGMNRVKAQVATEVPKAINEIKSRIFQALDKYTPPPKSGTTNTQKTIKAKQTDAPDGPEVPKPRATSLWTSKSVAGRKVYQRNDLFKPDYIDPQTGLSNKQLMEAGQAPIGRDGRPVNLHHMTQDEPGVMAEVGGRMHSDNDRILHMHSNQYDKTWVGPDGLRRSYSSAPPSMDRGPFNRWKREYWKERANDF